MKPLFLLVFAIQFIVLVVQAQEVNFASLQNSDVDTTTYDELGKDRSKENLGFSFYIATGCLLYTSPSPRDQRGSRMPSSA